MIAPVTRLTKAEVDWLGRHRCKHGHTYLEHYNCYQEEVQPPLVGFLDIEASNLKADFGILLSWCIKPQGKSRILCDVLTKKDLQEDGLDRRIVKSCIDAMRKFDKLVGHYSTKFDIPFLRSRALSQGLDFPTYGEINHTDCYYMAKRLLCISSNRQGNVARVLQGVDIKTRIDSQHWIGALQGNEKDLDYILDHNKKDVKQLEKNYEKLIAFTKNTNKSL